LQNPLRSILLFFLILVLSVPLGMTDESPRILAAEATRQGVGQNIAFVERLINESVAAKQIIEGDNEEAKALREKSIVHLKAAVAAQQQGDTEAVAEALSSAKQAIFAAMRLVGGKVVKDKKRENFNKKLQSLKSLLEAHQRVREEKLAGEGAGKKIAQAAVEVEEHVKAKMAEAQEQFGRGELDAAMSSVNSAYLSVKLSITQMHNGDRLVRSLHFETREDEYRYELDRNDTHKMLINTVLKEKYADPRLGKLMDIPLQKATALRGQAEKRAGEGDFDAAIKLLEESTQQVIRAIRMGGIYIPG
jgi:hypothetical protein